MQSKSTRRFKSFQNSLSNLSKSLTADKNADFVLEGTVRNYNLTFDLSWKVLKDVLLEAKGLLDFATGSPRDTLQAAFSNGLIEDDSWLRMLRLRNQLAHDYDGKLAEESFDLIITEYYSLFKKLESTLKDYFENDNYFKNIDSFK